MLCSRIQRYKPIFDFIFDVSAIINKEFNYFHMVWITIESLSKLED